MSFDDNGNTTGIPMFEGRVGYTHNMEAGKMKIYLSGYMQGITIPLPAIQILITGDCL
jgi:hypothetical protein